MFTNKLSLGSQSQLMKFNLSSSSELVESIMIKNHFQIKIILHKKETGSSESNFLKFAPLLHFLPSLQENVCFAIIWRQFLIAKMSLNEEKQEIWISSTHPYRKTECKLHEGRGGFWVGLFSFGICLVQLNH